MRKIVTPGDFLTDQRRKLGQNVYLKEGKVYSSVLGILSDAGDSISVIALNGVYSPVVGDIIVCVVSSESFNGYVLEFNSYTDTFLPKSLLSKELKIGTMLFARIKNINANGSIELDNVNILPKGRLFVSSCVKVPRLIGKNDSMLNVLKQHTKSNILIGRNGWIWYDSKQPELLEKAFGMIITNSQKSNLTESIKQFLEKYEK